MKLDSDELKSACFDIARNTMWSQKPVDVDEITDLANRFENIARSHLEYIEDKGRDPNLITRAVRYLEHSQAIPAMGKDTDWFSEMLQALIELACPNVVLDKRAGEFLNDLEEGIAEARTSIES